MSANDHASESASKSKRGRGRPKGSKTTQAKPAEHTRRPRCKRCQSTSTLRENQSRPNLACNGTDADGQPYDLVHWDWRNCQNCGFRWVDKWVSFRGLPAE